MNAARSLAAEPGEIPGRTGHLPGDLAVWVFILAEMAVFAIFFVAYAFARARQVELFDFYQQTLDRRAGALNTVLLISSSWLVALAVAAARREDPRAASRLLALGFLGGCGFVVVKCFEYAAKFAAGVTLSSNTFYMFYLSLTFFHFMHVLLGLVVLAVLWRRTRAGRADVNVLESGAAYWHMVDLLWIVLFPLVYVMR